MTDAAFPRTCFTLPGPSLGTIALHQQGVDDFTVIYGLQVKRGLDYATAASELGAAIMHRLACDGDLDNSEPGEDEGDDVDHAEGLACGGGWCQSPDGEWWRVPHEGEAPDETFRMFMGSGPFVYVASAQDAVDRDGLDDID